MASKFLDSPGITHLWEQIKALIDGKVDKVSSSTDNAVVRFDGTSGVVQNSGVTIDDSNNISTSGNVSGKEIIVHGTYASDNYRKISSGAASNMYVQLDSGGNAYTTWNTTEFRRGANVTNYNLGSSTYPWNNAYAKKWVTNGGTSSQFVKGDGSLDSNTYATESYVDDEIGTLTDGTAASESGNTIAIGEYDLIKIREIKGNSQVYENTVVGNTVENLDVYDNNDTKKGSLPLNLTELIGKANGEGTSVTIYPNGLHGVGTVYDSLIVDEDGYARRAIKRRDRVDLGSLSWSSARTGTSGKLRFSAALTGATSSALSNYLCTGYSAVTVDYTYLCVTGIAVANNLIYVYDSNKDTGYGNQFKAYVAGVYLDYELATPIEYVLDTPVQCVAKVYPNGTVKQVPVMPDSTPMVMDVTYLRDNGGMIGGLMNKLASLEARIAALEGG